MEIQQNNRIICWQIWGVDGRRGDGRVCEPSTADAYRTGFTHSPTPGSGRQGRIAGLPKSKTIHLSMDTPSQMDAPNGFVPTYENHTERIVHAAVRTKRFII